MAEKGEAEEGAGACPGEADVGFRPGAVRSQHGALSGAGTWPDSLWLLQGSGQAARSQGDHALEAPARDVRAAQCRVPFLF